MKILDGLQSALNPRSAQAAAASELAWLLFAGAGVVFLVVMMLVAYAAWKHPKWLGRQSTIVVAGAVLPAIVLLALLLHSLSLVAAASDGRAPAVRVQVVAHQWWWRVRYLHADGSVDFETANEIRIPAGQPIEIALASADVLHSFWVPNLAGKLDAIPGRTQRLRFTARDAGMSRGQCAEYCGGPHAQMALWVVAEPDDTFARWRETQRLPARASDETFLAYCAACHAIRGTPARGTLGPDLTHVGSRFSLAAATLPNDTGALAAWIVSSQHIKPGNLMPQFPAQFDGETLERLAAYLAALE
jgi:cytochrome c oxidase subunit 2